MDEPFADLIPRPCAEWQRNELGRVVITRPKPRSHGWRRLGDLLAFWLSTPRIRLDDMGTVTWLLMDGSRSVAEIAQALCERYPDSEQVEQRLMRFLSGLHSQDLISYGDDPVC